MKPLLTLNQMVGPLFAELRNLPKIVHANEKVGAFVELEREVSAVTFYLESIYASEQRLYIGSDMLTQIHVRLKTEK